MKFGKSLIRVVETSDPEWGPYWMNYKFLKKKINEIVEDMGGVKISDKDSAKSPNIISKSPCEVEFFRLIMAEVKKTSDFFKSTETIYTLRKERIWGAFRMLKDTTTGGNQVQNSWTRLLMACVKFYKDVLLLENFAIMNYCGFSKILKKHDKLTGYVTRDAFMRNVMNKQNFTHFPTVLQMIVESEKLFSDIQRMESVMPLLDEERIFIDAIRDLNHQASRMQAEEREGSEAVAEAGNEKENITTGSAAATISSDAAATSSVLVGAAGVTSAMNILPHDGNLQANSRCHDTTPDLTIEVAPGSTGEACSTTTTMLSGSTNISTKPHQVTSNDACTHISSESKEQQIEPTVAEQAEQAVQAVQAVQAEQAVEAGHSDRTKESAAMSDVNACLDVATASLVDATIRLNNRGNAMFQHCSSPSLLSVTSWMHTTKGASTDSHPLPLLSSVPSSLAKATTTTAAVAAVAAAAVSQTTKLTSVAAVEPTDAPTTAVKSNEATRTSKRKAHSSVDLQ